MIVQFVYCQGLHQSFYQLWQWYALLSNMEKFHHSCATFMTSSVRVLDMLGSSNNCLTKWTQTGRMLYHPISLHRPDFSLSIYILLLPQWSIRHQQDSELILSNKLSYTKGRRGHYVIPIQHSSLTFFIVQDTKRLDKIVLETLDHTHSCFPLLFTRPDGITGLSSETHKQARHWVTSAETALRQTWWPLR